MRCFAPALIMEREQVRIAHEQPAPVLLLAQDRQRIARTSQHRLPAGRRHGDGETVAEIGPIAEHLDLLDLARAFDAEIGHTARGGGELFLAEGLAAGTMKITSSAISDSTVSVSPVLLASIQVAT